MTNTKGISGILLGGTEWIFRFMYVHFLWIIFTILGLGIFGFMPATSAVFSITRKWLMKEEDISIFPYFLQTYKSTWKTSNFIGLVLLVIGIFLYFDIQISQSYLRALPLHMFLLLLCIIFFITCLFFFPVFVHYNLKPLQYVKQALIHSLVQPIYLLSILLWIFCAYIIFVYIPVLYVFMGATLISLPIMWFALMSFNKLEKKK